MAATSFRSFNIKQLANVLIRNNNRQICAFSNQLIPSKLFATNTNPYVVQRRLNVHPKTGWRKFAFAASALGIGAGLYSYLTSSEEKKQSNFALTEKSNFSTNVNLDDVVPSREVLGPAANLGFELTLFQYQTCPFCCKVRAFLEFYGIPFKIVEVNPVMRQQLKFSKYKKVPILIAQEKDSLAKHQLNDSSVIVSILGSLLVDISGGLESILKYYTPLVYTNDEGKQIEEVMNKYLLMYGENTNRDNDALLKKEREWRKWADNEFVHILSPNIYRSYDEALQAFNYFSVVGEWEKNFSTFERLVVIYVGATAMYFVGKKLKKKYLLKEDVRQSLYDACRLWMKEIGTKNKFMGGDIPNLADLAVYGLLSSIEGCVAFQDLLDNTNIGSWYQNVKESVVNHHGYQTIKA